MLKALGAAVLLALLVLVGMNFLVVSNAGDRVRALQAEVDELKRQQATGGGDAARTPFDVETSAQLGELRDVLQPPAQWYAVESGPPRVVIGERAACYALRRIVNVPKRGIGDRAEACVDAYAERERLSFWEALRRCEDVPGLATRSLAAIQEFVTMIDELRA